MIKIFCNITSYHNNTTRRHRAAWN